MPPRYGYQPSLLVPGMGHDLTMGFLMGSILRMPPNRRTEQLRLGARAKPPPNAFFFSAGAHRLGTHLLVASHPMVLHARTSNDAAEQAAQLRQPLPAQLHVLTRGYDRYDLVAALLMPAIQTHSSKVSAWPVSLQVTNLSLVAPQGAAINPVAAAAITPAAATAAAVSPPLFVGLSAAGAKKLGLRCALMSIQLELTARRLALTCWTKSNCKSNFRGNSSFCPLRTSSPHLPTPPSPPPQ